MAASDGNTRIEVMNGVGGIMISYLTCLDMEYWGMGCCGMSGATISHSWAGFYVKNDVTYLCWRRRSGRCQIFVYVLLLPHYSTSQDGIYIYGKVLTRRVHSS